jgi:DHA3 family macrolide efflux protein-like MFS transporter
MLVPKDQLVRANGWSQFMQSGAFMLGPVLGAALFAAFPLPVIMLTDVLGAIVACVTVALIKIPDPAREKRNVPNIFREMKQGAAVLFRDRRLFAFTVASTLCMVFYLPMSTLYPLMNSEHFSGTAWHASVIDIVYSGGMMLCSMILGTFGEIKNKYRIMHIAFISFGAVSLLSGLLPGDISYFWVFAVLCGLIGASANLSNIPFMAYLQQTIPPEAQGRVFSLIFSLMSLAMPVGLAVAGPVAEVYGVTSWFIVTGIAVIIIMLASAALTARLGRRDLR